MTEFPSIGSEETSAMPLLEKLRVEVETDYPQYPPNELTNQINKEAAVCLEAIKGLAGRGDLRVKEESSEHGAGWTRLEGKKRRKIGERIGEGEDKLTTVLYHVDKKVKAITFIKESRYATDYVEIAIGQRPRLAVAKVSGSGKTELTIYGAEESSDQAVLVEKSILAPTLEKGKTRYAQATVKYRGEPPTSKPARGLLTAHSLRLSLGGKLGTIEYFGDVGKVKPFEKAISGLTKTRARGVVGKVRMLKPDSPFLNYELDPETRKFSISGGNLEVSFGGRLDFPQKISHDQHQIEIKERTGIDKKTLAIIPVANLSHIWVDSIRPSELLK